MVVALSPSGFVIVTVTGPAEPAGVTTVRLVELLNVTELAGVDPKVTVAPLTKLLPVMATEVPPPLVPATGEILMTIGAGSPAVMVPFTARLFVNRPVGETIVNAPPPGAGAVHQDPAHHVRRDRKEMARSFQSVTATFTSRSQASLASAVVCSVWPGRSFFM